MGVHVGEIRATSPTTYDTYPPRRRRRRSAVRRFGARGTAGQATADRLAGTESLNRTVVGAMIRARQRPCSCQLRWRRLLWHMEELEVRLLVRLAVFIGHAFRCREVLNRHSPRCSTSASNRLTAAGCFG
jgi:hypothetical protein